MGASEIGGVKREIFFTGHVLDAPARIQGLCNSCGVDPLLSGELPERLPLGEPYTARALGTNETFSTHSTSLARQRHCANDRTERGAAIVE